MGRRHECGETVPRIPGGRLQPNRLHDQDGLSQGTLGIDRYEGEICGGEGGEEVEEIIVWRARSGSLSLVLGGEGWGPSPLPRVRGRGSKSIATLERHTRPSPRNSVRLLPRVRSAVI